MARTAKEFVNLLWKVDIHTNEDGTEEIWGTLQAKLELVYAKTKHSPVIQWGCGFSQAQLPQSQFLHLYVRLQFILMNPSMQA